MTDADPTADTPEKLDRLTPDGVARNIDRLAELFPGCVTETRDPDTGELRRGVDFDALRQELSDHVVEGGDERYRLDWPGKRVATLAANAPIDKTLRPVRAESVDFDTTQNILIEGDNLDALKLLQEGMLGKVDLIYIDPPYNRGSDLIYKDERRSGVDEYLSNTHQISDRMEKLVANLESNGRFHSDWLSSIFSRLKLARNLLSEQGVIFLSINDIEVSNLRKCCDEVFGQDNFVECYIWESTFRPDNSSSIYRKNAEFILCYARSKLSVGEFFGEEIERTGLPSLTKSSMAATVLEFPAKSVIFGVEDGHYAAGDLGVYTLLDDVQVCGKTNEAAFRLRGPVIWSQSYLESELSSGTKIIIKSNSFVPYSDKGDRGVLRPNKILPRAKIGDVLEANAALKALMGSDVFDYPKPVSLIEYLLKIRPEARTIMDFYAGSGTTGHAVMRVENEGPSGRRFILVQAREDINFEQISDAGAKDTAKRASAFLESMGKSPTISSLCVERLRRASHSFVEGGSVKKADLGFRVFKIASSNMRNFSLRPEQVAQKDLINDVDYVKINRTSEDLLFQVLLSWGVDISLPIVPEDVSGRRTFFVDSDALAACFEIGLDENYVKALAVRKPLRVVFRDSAFGGDDGQINVVQLFQQLSPNTEVKIL